MLYVIKENIDTMSVTQLINHIFKDYPDIINLLSQKISNSQVNEEILKQPFKKLNSDLLNMGEISPEYEKGFIGGLMESIINQNRQEESLSFLKELKEKENNRLKIEQQEADELLKDI